MTLGRTLLSGALLGGLALALLSLCSGPAPSIKQPTTASTAPPTAEKSPPELTAEEKRECQFVECPVGSVIITAPARNGPYYACQTEALSDYTNFVLGLVQMEKQIAGRFPNIDPQTGEPQFEGETKQMIENLRMSAGVQSFDQAGARCRYGPHGTKYTIMNYEKDRRSTWIGNEKVNFWVPTAEILIAKHAESHPSDK